MGDTKVDKHDFEILQSKHDTIGKRLKEISMIQTEMTASIVPTEINNSFRGEHKAKNQLQKLQKLNELS